METDDRITMKTTSFKKIRLRLVFSMRKNSCALLYVRTYIERNVRVRTIAVRSALCGQLVQHLGCGGVPFPRFPLKGQKRKIVRHSTFYYSLFNFISAVFQLKLIVLC